MSRKPVRRSRPVRLALLQESRLLGLTPQPSRLLRFLALNAGRAVPLGIAADLLAATGRSVPDEERPLEEESKFGAAVHSYIRQIRLVIGEDRIVTQRDPTTYTLHLASEDWVDVIEFDDLLAEGSKLLEDDDPARALKTVNRALNMWTINPAADLDYSQVGDSPLVRDTEYYYAKVRKAQSLRLEATMADGDTAAIVNAIGTLLNWQQGDERARYDEAVWHLASRAHIRTDNIGAAVDLFKDFVGLGGRPTRQYRQLVEAADSGNSLPGSQVGTESQVTLDDAMNAGLEGIQVEIRARGVAGSQRIRLGDLVKRSGLWVRPHGLNLSNGSPVDDILKLVLSLLIEHPGPRRSVDGPTKWIILGSPGIGKSTLGLRIFDAFINARTSGASGAVPFWIDLRSFRSQGVAEFTSEHWIYDQVAARLLSREAAERWQDDLHDREVFAVVDALDEFLIGRPQEQVQELLGAPLFRDAVVLMCRSQFYDQYVQGSDLAARYSILELGPWTTDDRQDYITSYYETYFGEEGSSSATDLLGRLRRSPEMARVCSVPVRLNMALDLLSPNNNKLPGEVDLITLYNTYLTNVLAIDATRPGSVLTADEKFDLLEELAWEYYEEGSMGEADPPIFSTSELREFLVGALPGSSAPYRQQVLDDLKNRTLLEATREERMHLGADVLHFSHKSFQEFLVATKVYHSLLRSVATTASVMDRYLSPEVGEFLKEYLKRLNGQPRMRKLVATSGMDALKSLLTTREGLASTPARMRISLEQLYYYLGSLEQPDVQDFLENQLLSETDPWLRRGLAIGLAFSGRYDPVNQYIDMLRLEREQRGTEGPENCANIGTKLSYFGDQPFEPAEPDVDRGLPSCSRTVSTLLYQLLTETERGCWRIDLYSLVDLWRWRNIARPSFRATLAERGGEVTEAMRSLEKDPFSASWPELEEFRAVVQDCGIEP